MSLWACRPTYVPDLFGLVIIKVMLKDPLILLTPERLAKFMANVLAVAAFNVTVACQRHQ